MASIRSGELSLGEVKMWAGVADWIAVQEAIATSIAMWNGKVLERWATDDVYRDKRTAEEIIADVIASDERRHRGL